VTPALAFSRVGETGPDVFTLQLRKFFEERFLARASGEVPEDVTDSDTSSAYTGLPESYGRIDADAVERAHDRQSRSSSRAGKVAFKGRGAARRVWSPSRRLLF
jgi:hypothetical protein